MGKQIRREAGRFALVVTRSVRAAGFVEEDAGESVRVADVRVFAFDGLLVVVDVERVASDDVADLVAAAARETSSEYRVSDASIEECDEGYRVLLPGARDAGFERGDSAAVTAAPGVFFVTPEGTRTRVAGDLGSLRRSQHDHDAALRAPREDAAGEGVSGPRADRSNPAE